jgi:hypothetical protein
VSRTRTATVAVVALAIAATLVVALTYRRSAGSTEAASETTSETVGARSTASSSAADALAVLHDWDSRRADAYASGSAVGLRDLYAPGSAAGVADLHLLQRYRSRGLRVDDLSTQLLGFAVTERQPDRWTLRVTDRLAGGVAVHGAQRTPLPRDASSTHVVTLVRGGDDRWRVSGVAAPTTRARPPDGS